MAGVDDDGLEGSDIKISASDSLAYQRDLKEEKELLEKILSKIDARMQGLQVERLHLLGLINKALKKMKGQSPPRESTHDSQQASMSKTLDLSVPSTYVFQEEIEDEDED